MSVPTSAPVAPQQPSGVAQFVPGLSLFRSYQRGWLPKDVVADGNIRWQGGGLPVNTHGGNLSEAYIIGMTHVREAVEQAARTLIAQEMPGIVATASGPAATQEPG